MGWRFGARRWRLALVAIGLAAIGGTCSTARARARSDRAALVPLGYILAM